MENERHFAVRSLWKWLLGASICAMIAGGGIGYYLYLHRDELPGLQYPDLGGQRQAGKAERILGSIVMRPVVPSDYPANPGKTVAGDKPIDPIPLKEQQPFYLGTLFKVPQGSSVQLITEGSWLIGMDGDGEYVLEEARTNQGHTLHTIYFYVRHGTFRAKPHDYDPTDHMLEVRTAVARIFLRGNGEIGMKINEGGSGQAWLNAGTGVVIWNDGRRRVLGLRGMEHI